MRKNSYVKAKILLIESDKEIHLQVQESLKHDFNIQVIEQLSLARKQLKKERPDLILLNLMLKEGAAHELCSELKSDVRTRDIPLIILGQSAGPHARVVGYQLGALNYLEIPFNRKELLAVVQSTLQAVRQLVEPVWQIAELSIHLGKQEVLLGEEKIDLTESEFKILIALIRKQGDVLTRQSILSIISTNRSQMTDRVVDTHISHLRKKILKSGIEIKSVYGSGYKLRV